MVKVEWRKWTVVEGQENHRLYLPLAKSSLKDTTVKNMVCFSKSDMQNGKTSLKEDDSIYTLFG